MLHLLTEADAKEIARHIREKRGNPNFGNTAKTKAKR
jgi:hypothetical protein